MFVRATLRSHAQHHEARTGLRFPLFTLCGVWLCSLRSITKAAHQARARTLILAAAAILHDKFAEEVKRNAQLIIIPDEWKEKFLAKIETWESEVSLEKQQKIDALKSDLTSLKAKIDRIDNGFTEGSIDIAEFKELKNPLVIQKTYLEQQIVALEESKLKRLEPLRKWVLEANEAQNGVISDDWLKMKSFLQKNGSNRFLRAQTLTVSFKKPFALLAKTTVAAQRAASESERNSIWWRRRELNPRPKSTNQPRLHAYPG